MSIFGNKTFQSSSPAGQPQRQAGPASIRGALSGGDPSAFRLRFEASGDVVSMGVAQ